jgi:hypothetical protein
MNYTPITVMLTLLVSAFLFVPTQLTHASETSAKWQVGAAWGKGLSRWTLINNEVRMRPETWRITIARTDIYEWALSDKWDLLLDVDASVHHWNDPWRDSTVSVVSAVPMWRFEYDLQNNVRPFIRLGIGVAVLDDKDWMDREMGAHIMFEDKLEIGASWQSHQVALGISHFSNANLASINHGANVHYVSYAYRW